MFKKIAGTKDILPLEATQWQSLEDAARKIFELYNYRQIRLPAIEEAALFDRSLGDSTEIVQKQMFLIKHGADVFALRPEGTAGVVRAYIENQLDKTEGFIKFYYTGPMFRLERPQKGRLRQFSHIGCEAIGSADPAIDAELISLADCLLTESGISGYKIKINTLGCAKDKKALADFLRKSLSKELGKLCADCKIRYKKNVLRVLDCKEEACRRLVRAIKLDQGHLCADCRDNFLEVRRYLDSLKVGYEFDPLLVRGLDYYTRTVFEISHPGLGAQDAVGAGGRYDNLLKELGGPDQPACGFAFGVERLLLVASQKSEVTNKDLVFLIALGDKAKQESVKLLDALRKNNISADTDYENKSLKGAMRRANDLKAKFVLIIGDDELNKNVVTLKDMQSGSQEEVKMDGLLGRLINNDT